MVKKIFKKLAAIIQKKPKTIITVVLAITAIMALGLSKLQLKMGNDVFVSSSSKVYKDTSTYQKHFGGDSAYILISGKQADILSHQTFKKINKLESKLNDVDNVRSTTSLLSLINQELSKPTTGNSIMTNSNQDSKQGQKLMTDLMDSLSAKDKVTLQESIQQTLTTPQKTALNNYTINLLTPQQKAKVAAGQDTKLILTGTQLQQTQAYMMANLNAQQQKMMATQLMKKIPPVQSMSTVLLRDLVLNANGNVKSNFKTLLPSNGKSILIMVNTSDKTDMSTMVQLKSDINHQIKSSHISQSLRVRVAGNPAVMGDVKNQVMQTMMEMLALAVVIMIVVLLIVFPVRRKLLALAFVMLALVWTFGLMGLLRLPITLATMATLPIIIGLGTDFGVQFHNRYEEEFKKNLSSKEAITTAIMKMGPAVGIAVIVMAFSFLTMYLSKAPMMQQFGLTLVIGILSAYIVEFLLMFSTLGLLDRHPKLKKQKKLAQPSKISLLLAQYANFVMKHAMILTIIGVVSAIAGFSLENKIPIETNMMKMIPQDMQSLKDTKYLQKKIGSTTYITFLVKDNDVTNKHSMNAVDKLAQDEDNKYKDILDTITLKSTYVQINGSISNATQAQVTQNVDNLPNAIKSSVIGTNKHYTTVQFKVNGKLSSDDQKRLMDKIDHDLNSQHHSFEISPAGAQVMMLLGITNVSANHWLIIFAGLAIIFIVLLIVYRKFGTAILPVLPIAVVLGLSPLTLYLIGESYNPLTIALSSLVLGIGTEFTILILERYKEELDCGKSVKSSIVSSLGSVGQAITVSGLTVIGGFAAIIFANFPVLSSFGLITVLDTMYSLVSALTILPAIIVIGAKFSKKLKHK
ncbi:hydrogenase expression protein HypA [Lactiplantibacillus pentosus]|uniref:efflux RND transporter permease subunit n=1 Tax=Lactiplantibacillus pentosus TaxID=1589 RepID=UPI000D01EE4C|nr:hydrophobe/amphiphile efflux-3 (HAE3) family transporter [Lactiplantibacillus pentosus]PRO83285.1 hydrogenase expression protein HypA [Lactiplantibacillus pentosus]